MGKARQGAEKHGKGIEAAMGRLKTSFNDTISTVNRLGGMMAVAAATGFAMMIKSAINTADNMSKTAQKIGISTEALSTLSYAADISGTSMETLQKGLQKLSKGVLDASMGMGDARDALAALDIEIADSNGNLKNSEQILKEVADKFVSLNDGTAKTAIAMKLFGRSGAELIPMLNQGSIGINALQDAARELGIEIDTKTGQAAERFNDQLLELKTAGKGLTYGIMNDMLPALNDIAQAMIEARKEGGKLMMLWVALGGIGNMIYGTTMDQQIKALKTAIEFPATDPFTGLTENVDDLKKKLADLETKKAQIDNAEKERSKGRAEAEEKIKQAREAATKALERGAASARDKEASGKKAAADAEQLRKQQEAAIMNMDRERESIFEVTREQKMLFEVTSGSYAKFDPAQKSKLILMAREIDLLQSLIKEEERVNAIRDSIDQQNMGLLEQAEVLGMTTREATLYRMAMAGATEEQINFADSQLAVIERHEKLKGVIADLVTPLDEYADKLRTLDELYAAGEISLYSYQKAAEKYAKDLKDSTKSEFDELKQAIEGWGKSSSEAIVDFAMTGKTSFADMIDSMISDILRMLVYQNLTKPLATSISGFTGSALSELGGDWSGMVFEQHGDAFSRGRILPYARGGVVDRPTIFPMAHGYGLMGEAGAEGILPLKRTASGDLGVQASGAGGAVTVNIINNAGAEVSQSSRETPRGMEIDVMIDAAVGKKLSTFGSQSNKAVRQNFGARETLVAR
jgi:hypothetical protein